MKINAHAHRPRAGSALLTLASLLLPREMRREWLTEWRSELWYVHHGRRVGSVARLRADLSFCLGSFQDAWWLKKNAAPGGERSPWLRSPQDCGVSLAVVAAAAVGVLLCFPSARQAMMRRHAVDGQNLVFISRAGVLDPSSRTITVEEYQAWRERRRHVIGELAFLRPSQMKARLGAPGVHALNVVQASRSLPGMLQAPVSAEAMQAAEIEHKASVVLSYLAWKDRFSGDADLIGKDINLDGRAAKVVGIMPDEGWRVTSRPDAWLLERDSELASLPAETRGLVLGQVAAASPATRGRWQFEIPKDGGADVFDCIPVVDRTYRPWMTFLFTLLLAVGALPATTPLPLGDYPAADHPLFAAMRSRRWIFLGMKLGLVVAIVYCVSTTLAFADVSLSANASVYIQFSTSFLGLLLSFRWVLRDQRRRCPVCLHVLTNPVSVGHPSRNFLAWHGTELMCTKGHGLLHVPEMATSWFSTQRWLCLDPSWKALFSDSYLRSAGVS